jgi:uncharacterized protein (DUF362 family)
MSSLQTKFKAFIAHIDSDYKAPIQDGLRYIKFAEYISPTSRIFIKPNLTYPSYIPGVMTSPQAIEGAILALREYTPHISIGDSDSGGYNRFSMDEVYSKTGIADFAEKYNVEVVNLSHCVRKTVHFDHHSLHFDLDLPRLLTDEIDLLITMPVPKVHANTGVSLTFKNQWGCIPEPADRLRLHPYFKQVILEVNRVVKSKIAIIDGKYGLNVNGPMQGSPVEMNWVMVTNDIGAGALLSCELMQIPLEQIEHLRYAKKLGFIPERHQIATNQALDSFINRKFVLRRKWTDYPGYLAFHSAPLAYLAYFSPLAGLLHKLLYVFRKPLYDYDRYSKRP